MIIIIYSYVRSALAILSYSNAVAHTAYRRTGLGARTAVRVTLYNTAHRRRRRRRLTAYCPSVSLAGFGRSVLGGAHSLSGPYERRSCSGGPRYHSLSGSLFLSLSFLRFLFLSSRFFFSTTARDRDFGYRARTRFVGDAEIELSLSRFFATVSFVCTQHGHRRANNHSKIII